MTGFYRLPVTGSRGSGSTPGVGGSRVPGEEFCSTPGVGGLVLFLARRSGSTPGEEFWFCSWRGVLVLVLARSSGSAS